MPGTQETWEAFSGYAQLHIFLIDGVSSNVSFVSQQDFVKNYVVKIHKLFDSVFTTVHEEKPAWSTEPVLLTLTLLMNGATSDAGSAD